MPARVTHRVVARFYSAESFWNRPVGANPAVDPHSVAMIKASIVPFAARSAFANGDDWGIALVHASASDKVYDVTCLQSLLQWPGHLPHSAGRYADHRVRPPSGGRGSKEGTGHVERSLRCAERRVVGRGPLSLGDLYGRGANASPGTHAGGAVAAGFSGDGRRCPAGGDCARAHRPRPQCDDSPPAYRTCRARLPRRMAQTRTRFRSPKALTYNLILVMMSRRRLGLPGRRCWPRLSKLTAPMYPIPEERLRSMVRPTGTAGNEKWSTVGAPKNPYLASLPWNRMKVLDLRAVPSWLILAKRRVGLRPQQDFQNSLFSRAGERGGRSRSAALTRKLDRPRALCPCAEQPQCRRKTATARSDQR